MGFDIAAFTSEDFHMIGMHLHKFGCEVNL